MCQERALIPYPIFAPLLYLAFSLHSLPLRRPLARLHLPRRRAFSGMDPTRLHGSIVVLPSNACLGL